LLLEASLKVLLVNVHLVALLGRGGVAAGVGVGGEGFAFVCFV
jgi:hypothetical protein